MEIVPLYPADLHSLDTDISPDTVVHMDNVVSHLYISEVADALAGICRIHPLTGSSFPSEQFLLRNEDEPSPGKLKALRNISCSYYRLIRTDTVRIIVSGKGSAVAPQNICQRISLLFTAAEEHHRGIYLPPRPQILRQHIQLLTIGRHLTHRDADKLIRLNCRNLLRQQSCKNLRRLSAGGHYLFPGKIMVGQLRIFLLPSLQFLNETIRLIKNNRCLLREIGQHRRSHFVVSDCDGKYRSLRQIFHRPLRLNVEASE